jgi:hypothetical protein
MVEKDWEAEAAKWKALSRKHEARAKEAAEKLRQIRAVVAESSTPRGYFRKPLHRGGEGTP